MINFAIGCFVLAALGGIFLLTYVLTNRETPKAIVMAHGLFAASGLVLLIIHALQAKDLTALAAGLFAIAAIVGFYMFSRDITGKPIPKAVAVTHGAVAALVLGSLIYYVYI